MLVVLDPQVGAGPSCRAIVKPDRGAAPSQRPRLPISPVPSAGFGPGRYREVRIDHRSGLFPPWPISWRSLWDCSA